MSDSIPSTHFVQASDTQAVMGALAAAGDIDRKGHGEPFAQVGRGESAALHVFLGFQLNLILAAEAVFRAGQINFQFQIIRDLNTSVVEPGRRCLTWRVDRRPSQLLPLVIRIRILAQLNPQVANRFCLGFSRRFPGWTLLFEPANHPVPLNLFS